MAERAVGVLRRLSEAHPDRPGFRFDYADGCSQLGGTLAAAGRPDEALASRREAVRVGDELVARYPGNDRYRAGLAAYQAHLAREYTARNDPAAAEPLFLRSLEANRGLVARYPHDPVRYQFFADASRRYGHLLLAVDRNPDRYWALARERMEVCDRARAQPDWPWIVAHLVHPEPAAVLDRFGRRADADRVMAHGLTVWGELAARHPPVTGARVRYVGWLTHDGHRRWPADPAGAGAQFRRAKSQLEPAPGQTAEPTEVLSLVSLLATCPDPVVRDTTRALALARQAAPADGSHRATLGVCLYEAGEYPAARAELEAFVAGRPGRPDPDRWPVARLYLAMALWRTGERDRAVAEVRAEGEVIRADPRETWQTLATLEKAERVLAE